MPAVASVTVVAQVLDGGRTAHSILKIPAPKCSESTAVMMLAHKLLRTSR